MINRFLSNIPFNPSLVNELSFYSSRLKRESSIRRLGFILIILSLLVQIFAAAIPAEKSLASSCDKDEGNDVICGGVSSLENLQVKYSQNSAARGLFKKFGLDQSDLNHRTASLVDFNFKQQGAKGTKTVGRINFTYTNDHYLGKFSGVDFFSRSAGEWNGSSKAIYFGVQEAPSGDSYAIWVIKDCGNLAYRKVASKRVTTAPPQPTAPPPGRLTFTPTTAPTPAPVIPAVVPTPTPVIPTTPPPKAVPRKEAINLTQNLSPTLTSKTKAKSGDVIEYRLFMKNTGGEAIKNFEAVDYVGDILDYADIELSSIDQNGAFLKDTKTIKWPAQNIAAGSEVQYKFKVKLKKKIPATNKPHNLTTQYDCKMQNGFGDTVVIPVACSIVKKVETLPNTGPGTSIGIAFTVATIGGYFFARSNLLSKELVILRKSYGNTGE